MGTRVFPSEHVALALMGHCFARSLPLSGVLLPGLWPVGPHSYPFRFRLHPLMFSPGLRGLRGEAREKNVPGLPGARPTGLASGHRPSLSSGFGLNCFSRGNCACPWILTQPDQGLGCPDLNIPAVSLDRPRAVCLRYQEFQTASPSSHGLDLPLLTPLHNVGVWRAV